MRSAEQLEELWARFEKDLAEVFTDRTPDLRQPLREMLFELWLKGTHEAIEHNKPKTGPINGGVSSGLGSEMRFDEATGFTKAISEDEALQDLEGKLDTIIQMNGSLQANVLSTQGHYPTPVPVMMDPQTGQMFGIDVTTRTKYTVQQHSIKLTSIDGWTWETPLGEQPPTRSDPMLNHIQVYADGALKQLNVDFNAMNGWTTEEVIQSIFFLSGCLEDTADVRMIWSDFDTSYY